MPQSLESAIRSLLRPARRGPAGPLGTLPPIGPSFGAADWTPTTFPRPGGGGAVVEAALRIEPGLLSFGGATPTLPLSIYTTDELAAWLAGTGVAIPGAAPARSTLLVGRLLAAPELTPPLDWPDDPPVASVLDGAYESALYASTATLAVVLGGGYMGYYLGAPAGAHTGEARAWAEACLATGRALSARVPAGCSTAPGALGMIWSPDGVPWAVSVGESGALAWRMAVSELTAPLLEWVRDGDLTDLAAHLAMLYVRADLAPLETYGQDDVVELVTEAAMAAAYADGGPLVMAGWVWPQQSVVTGGPVQCASVLGGVFDAEQVSQGFQTRVCTIAITWSDAAPGGALTVGSLDRWRPYWSAHKMWVGSPDNLALLRGGRIYPGQGGCGTSGPVTCWYTDAGALQVWRYFSPEMTSGGTVRDTVAGVSVGGTAENLFTTGNYARSVVGSGTWTKITGGFGVAEPAPIYTGSGAYTTRTLQRTLGGWDNGYRWAGDVSGRAGRWDSMVGGQNSWAQVGPDGGAYLYPYPNDPPIPGGWGGKMAKWYVKSAAAQLKISTDNVTNGGGGQICVYLDGCPDAIWSASVRTADREWGTRDATWSRAIYGGARMDIVDYYTDATIVSGLLLAPSIMQICWSGETNFCLGGARSADPAAQPFDRSGVVEARAALSLSGVEVATSTDWSPWAGALSGDGTQECQAALWALVSARPSRGWEGYPGADWESDCGLLLPAAWPNAQSWAGG